jgi:hypothetical protein
MTLRPCWYHGKETRDGLWQVDAAHPGVWLSSTRVSACWYTGQSGTVVTAELRTKEILDLRDTNTFTDAVRRAFPGRPLTQIRRAHTAGNLYLLEDGAIQNALVAEVFRTHAGVILRDRTAEHTHLSLVVQTPEVLIVRSEQVISSFGKIMPARRRVRQL